MKPSPEQMRRRQQAFRLWTGLTLVAVVGAYLFSWVCLLVIGYLQH
jgi:hypothetical protein